MAEKVVRITRSPGGAPVASPYSVHVAQNEDTVRWNADFQFAISFGASMPVAEEVSGGRQYSWRSGPFPHVGKYKYSIMTPDGHLTDPEVEVGPGGADPRRPPTGPRRPPNFPPDDDD
jgi:hypothetical protein